MSKSASKSASQIMVGSFIGRIVNLLTMIVITPTLGPKGFGDLVVVSVVSAIFNVIIDVGFENYYIIKVKLAGPDKTADEDVKSIEDVVFLMRLYSNLILFTFQVALSYILSGTFLHAPTDLYLRILAFNYLFSVFGKINEIRFRKRIDFFYITVSKIVSDIAGSLVKIVLIFSGMGIAGFAIGVVAGVFVNSAMLSFHGRYTPRTLKISKKWYKEVFWFAKHSWLTGVGFYLQQQVHNIILKFFFPVTQIGLFQFSNSYTVEMQTAVTTPQGSMLFPYIANHQHDKQKIIKGLAELSIFYFLLMAPAICIGIIYSRELIELVFKSEWLPAENILKVFLVYVLLRICISPMQGIITALGKMKESTKLSFIQFFTIAIGLLATAVSTRDIFWYAVAFVCCCMVNEIRKATWGLKMMNIKLMEVLIHFRKQFLFIGLFFGLLYSLKVVYPNQSLIIMIAIIVVSLVSYYLLQLAFNKKDSGMILAKVKGIVKKGNK